MEEIQEFVNAEFGTIRAIEIDNEPWFVGKDIAEKLGYSKPSDAVMRHVDEDDKRFVMLDIAHPQNVDVPIGQSKTAVISESGLYSLILSSKLPSAKKFKHWVTSEVLPAIRKHKVYATEELLANPDLAIEAFKALKEERERRKQLEQRVEQDRPKVIFANAVECSSTSILIGDLAKLLRQNGCDIGQKRLFEKLRDEGYLMKTGTSRNLPTQRYMDAGLFEIKESTINNPDGSIRINRTTKVTGKGQTYFINKFLGGAKSNGV